MMKKTIRAEPIPAEIARQLCSDIRAEAEKNWHTASARWCWQCRRSYEDRGRVIGYQQKPGNRGCLLVNARYAKSNQ